MKPIGRRALFSVSVLDLIKFFSIENGMWQVRGKGLPKDCRVLSVNWNNHRDVIEFMLETDDPMWFFELGKGQSPPNIDVYTQITQWTPEIVDRR